MAATSLMSVAIWRSDLTSLTQAGIWHRGHLACSLQSAFSIQPLHSRLWKHNSDHTYIHTYSTCNKYTTVLKYRLHCPTSRSPLLLLILPQRVAYRQKWWLQLLRDDGSSILNVLQGEARWSLKQTREADHLYTPLVEGTHHMGQSRSLSKRLIAALV